jgi:hypothetical protein
MGILGKALVYLWAILGLYKRRRTVGGFAQNGRRFCTGSVQRMYRNSIACRGEIMVCGVKLMEVLSFRQIFSGLWKESFYGFPCFNEQLYDESTIAMIQN